MANVLKNEYVLALNKNKGGIEYHNINLVA